MDSASAPTEVVDGTGPTGPTPASSPAFVSGDVLGRYTVLEHIGSGGMGEVYRAHDPRLGRDVALKRWRDATSIRGSSARERMQREAQAMARLAHPNVVPVYDVEISESGLLIAMEFVEGTTLEAWLDTRPGWRAIIVTFADAGRGLTAAHEAGLVHRDFKPANVLIGPDGRARVTDFGLATAAQGAASQTTGSGGGAESLSGEGLSGRLTQAGTVMGTPGYMSPEQHAAGVIEAPSDQFAFCVALFEALFDKRPFAGRGRRLYDAKRQGIMVSPGPSSIPRAVLDVITRGLQADPQRRWPSMRVMLRRLEGAARGRRVVPWATGGVAVAAAALWSFFAGAPEHRSCDGTDGPLANVWNDARARSAEDSLFATQAPYAQATFATVRGRVDTFATRWRGAFAAACAAPGTASDAHRDASMACLQRQLDEVDAFVEVLTQADEATVRSAARIAGSLPHPDRCIDPNALARAAAPPSDPTMARAVDRVQLMLAQSDALLGAGKYDASRRKVDEAMAASSSVDHPPLRADVLLHAARSDAALDDVPGAERNFTDAYFLATELGDAMIALDASVRLVAVIGDDGGRPVDAAAWVRRADAELARVGHAPRHASMLASNKGRVLAEQARFEEAEVEFRRAVELDKSAELGAMDLAGDVKDLATVLKHLDRDDEALALLREALDLIEQEVGLDHPSRAITLDELGNVFRKTGRFDEALEVQEQALAMHERLSEGENGSIVTSYNNLAVTLGRLERHEEAEKYLRLAVDYNERALGAGHPDVGRTVANLANAVARQDRHGEAQALYLRAREVFAEAIGPESPAVAIVSINLGDNCMTLERHADAEGYFAAAHAIAKRANLGRHADAAISFGRARAMWALHQDRDRALELASAALATLDAMGEGVRRDRDQIAAWIDERDRPGSRP